MLVLALLAGCTPVEAPAPPPPEPVPDPVQVPVPVPEVTDAASLAAVLQGPLELGSCRKGAVRVEGTIVARAKRPEEAAWMTELLSHESLPVAAIAAGMLFDAKVVLEPKDLEPVGTLLGRLKRADPQELLSYGCRKLKGVKKEGRIWNARGDALALLAMTPDKAAARTALKAANDAQVAEVGAAALGDPEAHAHVTELAFRQLCAQRTWETSWMLRALDSGVPRGSLLPLGMMSTGGCDYLEETGKMPTEGATSKARPSATLPGSGH